MLFCYNVTKIKRGKYKMQPFKLNDQFGKEHSVESMPKIIVVSFGKDTGELIGNYFNAQDNNYLKKHDIKVIADVSGVPSILRKTIIVPKMKKYNFEILLSTDKEFTNQFSKKDGKLTVIKIENNQIIDTIFVDSQEMLKGVIEG